MASPKTRATMARVAAAAVFAAGASLAVVGTASAQNAAKSPTTNENSVLGVAAGQDGAVLGLTEGATDEGATDEGATDEGATDEGATDEGATDEGATDEGATDEGATDEGATDEGATDEGATDEGATDEGSSTPGTPGGGGDDEGSSDGSGTPGGDGGNGGPQGVNQGSTGPEPASEGSENPIEQPAPDEDLTEQQTVGGQDRDELAETGASMNQALLFAGAATMIAGGVAFRYLPRLITKGGGGGAAAA